MTVLPVLSIAAILILPIQAQVTTSQYDNARTATASKTALATTPAYAYASTSQQ
jgi:hypothetical protein